MSLEQCSDNLYFHYIPQKMRQDLLFPTHDDSYHLDNYWCLYVFICGQLLWEKSVKYVNMRAFSRKIFKILSLWLCVEELSINLCYLCNAQKMREDPFFLTHYHWFGLDKYQWLYTHTFMDILYDKNHKILVFSKKKAQNFIHFWWRLKKCFIKVR